MYLGLHNPDHYLMLIICYPSKYNLKCLFADGSSEISFIIAISTLMQLYTTSAMTQPARRTFLPGHVVVIICSLIIQTLNLARTVHLEHNTRTSLKIAIFAYLGLLLLSYPLLGYIADVCLTRYRTLKCSFIFLIVGCTIGLLTASSNTILKVFNTKQSISENASIVGISIIGILITTGVGLFEANALQFGLDQLLEAPTLKLISFIHWYYWTHNVVQLVAMYLMTSSLVIDSSINHLPQHEGLFIKNALVFTVVAILGLAAVGSLVLLHKSKRHLYILRAGLNPFKNIYKVLKYSWNHKVPEHRSAFTYWEEDVPRRIDLGRTSMEDHLPMRRWRTQDIPTHPASSPVSVWIPSSRGWLTLLQISSRGLAVLHYQLLICALCSTLVDGIPITSSTSVVATSRKLNPVQMLKSISSQYIPHQWCPISDTNKIFQL